MGIEGETDELLLARVRDDGDVDAFGFVYERHVAAARRFARSLCANDADADDLTAEVFTGLLASLRRGNGPTELALPYLFASIKHRHWRTTGRRAHETAVACTAQVGGAARDANDIVEADVVRTALATLPDDVQVLLWRTEVDDEGVDDAAERHGTSAHNLAVHRHRARRALGTAYLAQHVEPDGGPGDLDPECRATLAHLASLVRNKIGIRRRRRLEKHLAVCARLLPDAPAPRAHQHPPARPSDAAMERLGGRADHHHHDPGVHLDRHLGRDAGRHQRPRRGHAGAGTGIGAAHHCAPRVRGGHAHAVRTPRHPLQTVVRSRGAARTDDPVHPTAGSASSSARSQDQPPAPPTSQPAEHPIHTATTSDPPPTVIPTSAVVGGDQAVVAAAADLAATGAATADRASSPPPATEAAVGADRHDGEGGSVASGSGGNGQADGADTGKGSVQRETDGIKSGQDDTSGPSVSSGRERGVADGLGVSSGHGDGNGPGVSRGQGNGNADGPGVSSGRGNGVSDGPGVSSGQGNGNANGPGVSSGQGNGIADGPGVSSGQGNGVSNGPGVSSGLGNGNGQGLAKGREEQAGGGVEDDIAPEVIEVVANGV